jgi:hypothetical protein
MTAWIYSGIAFTLVAAAGAFHGVWTGRWAQSAELSQAAAKLSELPLSFGDWEGKEIDSKQAGPGVTGCIQRSYTHRRRNITVVIALVNGRPGPVATHTPEVCYGANGYLVGEKKSVTVGTGSAAARFWTSDAVKKRQTEESRIRLYWAWNGGDGWEAAKDARVEFQPYNHPVLHKLYVLRDLSQAGGDVGPESCQEFLEAFLPVMQRTLFSAN